MHPTGLAEATRFLVFALAALYAVAALAGAMFIDFDAASDRALWLGLLLGGAIAMVVGQLAARSSAWGSAILVSVGAAAGGLPLFWTILVPIAVAAVVACSIALARRASAAA